LVGSAFIRQLQALIKANTVKKQLNVILISKSKTALISEDYLPLSLEDWESRVNSSSAQHALKISELVTYLEKSPDPVILVDNTSNEELAQAYPQFISRSVSIATPNKKAFSSNIRLWDDILAASSQPNGGLVYHEATVGAGLPVLSTLNDLVDTGDKVIKVEGIVSGSLSYCLNEFSKIGGSSLKFSDIVAKAKSMGYTEPDPREDLNGLDVARKVTILSRLSGFMVESPSSFPVQSLIPKPLESVVEVQEFMDKLPLYDDEMDKLRKEAEAERKVLRFVGKVDLSESLKSVKVGIEK
jgi:homoserine dehydrogenase